MRPGAAMAVTTRPASEGLSKHFPGVDALVDVDFDLKPGEVHVLFGENGAGKSTLISLLAGADQPTRGRSPVPRRRPVELDSRPRCPGAGHQRGVPGILAGPAALGRGQPVPRRRARRAAASCDKRAMHGADRRDPRQARLSSQSRRARRATCRAPSSRWSRSPRRSAATPSILILDEPTASLTERETDRLFALIDQAKRQGVGIIYITHRMGEIRRIGDRITVLRDGRKVATRRSRNRPGRRASSS